MLALSRPGRLCALPGPATLLERGTNFHKGIMFPGSLLRLLETELSTIEPIISHPSEIMLCTDNTDENEHFRYVLVLYL